MPLQSQNHSAQLSTPSLKLHIATLIEKTTTFHNLFQFVPVRSSWGISALRWSRCGPGVSCAPCVAAPVEDALLSKPRRLDRDIFAVSISIYLEYSWILMNLLLNSELMMMFILLNTFLIFSYLSLRLICSLRALHIAAFQVIADSRTSTHSRYLSPVS